MRLSLPARFDVTAEEAMRDLCGSVADLVEIDAGAVAKIDAAGVQLMCAVASAVRARGGRLTWVSVSQVFRDATRILGVDAALSLPDVG